MRDADDRPGARGMRVGENAMAQEASRLALVLEHVPGRVALFDRDMRCLAASRRWRDECGLPQDVVGQPPDQLLPERWQALYRRALEGETVECDDDADAGSTGVVRRRWRLVPWRDETGAVAGILMTSEEIQARDRAEAQSRETEGRLHFVTDRARVGHWHWDLIDDRLEWSAVCKQLFGLEPDCPMSYLRFLETLHPEDRERTAAAVRACLEPAGENEFDVEYRVVWPDGAVHWIHAKGSAEFQGARPVRMAGIVLDVCDRKRAQARLLRSEARFRSLVLATSQLIWTLDAEGRVTEGHDNESWAEFTGQTWPEMQGLGWLAAIHPDDRPEVQRRWLQAVQTETTYHAEYRLRGRNGAYTWFAASGTPLRSQSGAIAEWIGSSNDISDRKRAEEDLRLLNATLEQRVADALASRRLWIEVMEASGAFIQVLDRNYRFLAINRANLREYERIYGVRPSIGMSLDEVLAALPDAQEAARALWQRAMAGENFTEIAEFGDPGRDRRWYQMAFSPLRGVDGTVIGACLISTDVTEQVHQRETLEQTRAQLLETQKMETVGQLTGGVAHDFNNLLAAIMGNLELLRKRVAHDERSTRYLEGAIRGAERGAALTRRLLAFARRQALKAETVDLAVLLEDMRELLARSLGPGVRIVTDVPPALPAVTIDANQLELAILNLAVNARDAMPLGGTLSVVATPDRVEVGRPAAGLSPGAYVRIDFIDSGQGMDGESLRRAAEPFFTTKGVGKGTGLGLSMVQGLAAQSGGVMTIESTLGKGTTVRLWLPQAPAPAGEVDLRTKRAPPDPAPRRQRTLCVLVVDDDPLVSMGTAAMLEDLGHTAIEAASGRAALSAWEDHPRIDVVITDHAMPGMTGLELAQRLREAAPSLPIVLATGFADLPAQGKLDIPLLAKPFRQEDLARALHALLPEAGEPGTVIAFRKPLPG